MALLRQVLPIAVVVVVALVLRCDALVPELYHECAGPDDKMNYGEFVECMWLPFDDDKNGVITRDEFFTYLMLERHISPLVIPRMFDRSDLHKDGVINDADLIIVFDHMDTDHNNLLSEQEFERHRDNALNPQSG